jgi:pyruvate/2-oxoglutarate/acetoin dehydrogenase E1 component
MTYKEHLSAAMTDLAKNEHVCFIGYNVKYGRAAGTLNDVKDSQLFEMPLAENLMMGAAVGMYIGGKIPVVYFERMDFILCALDALVNHLIKLDELSGGIHRPACIVRCVVGNSKTPLYTGPTHTQNFSSALRSMGVRVIELDDKETIQTHYAQALDFAKHGSSTVLVDFKDDWNL